MRVISFLAITVLVGVIAGLLGGGMLWSINLIDPIFKPHMPIVPFLESSAMIGVYVILLISLGLVYDLKVNKR